MKRADQDITTDASWLSGHREYLVPRNGRRVPDAMPHACPVRPWPRTPCARRAKRAHPGSDAMRHRTRCRSSVPPRHPRPRRLPRRTRGRHRRQREPVGMLQRCLAETRSRRRQTGTGRRGREDRRHRHGPAFGPSSDGGSEAQEAHPIRRPRGPDRLRATWRDVVPSGTCLPSLWASIKNGSVELGGRYPAGRQEAPREHPRRLHGSRFGRSPGRGPAPRRIHPGWLTVRRRRCHRSHRMPPHRHRRKRDHPCGPGTALAWTLVKVLRPSQGDRRDVDLRS